MQCGGLPAPNIIASVPHESGVQFPEEALVLWRDNGYWSSGRGATNRPGGGSDGPDRHSTRRGKPVLTRIATIARGEQRCRKCRTTKLRDRKQHLLHTSPPNQLRR